ncbi:glutamyl-Q tRNA(Asp) synthetase [Polynucleobacter meluiroseus]|uniref:Glutamyl-Q tRNA(Asp) synthetase n=1 Tax=Polynucleobacter meluiroseus TaxID=1938814 RepID=A0A240E3W0_9BURK|nr:tRNA glutamyl-Q(34) synthetase GluQRS [Polynucleobacter meluiroseus]SNX29221.1 glutamyl-Q tRNA(Asp) synthetase [Polynucleobacter meluiroseus]
MILAVSNLKTPSSPSDGYCGRFAPSPTGPLHAGSLATALGSWLDARAHGGQWLVRMEDIDTPRCIPQAGETILEQLQACGLYWDGEVSWQSHIGQQKRYQAALEHLNTLQALYPCTCSRQTITNTLAAQGIVTPRNQEQVYPGSCRPRQMLAYSSAEFTNPSTAWRLALSSNTEDLQVRFTDQRLGPQLQNLTGEVGDFVVKRSDGLFTYQLAVVVDDASQGITHIVRGEDLLSNTARQIYLQTILGYPTPQYLHLPLVLDAHGEKLSKQTLATGIQTDTPQQALNELRKAATHLGLHHLPSGDDVTTAEWLLAATHAWTEMA